MADKLGHLLVACSCSLFAQCLAIESADRTASAAATLLLQQLAHDGYLDSGHCALRTQHQTLPGTSLVICSAAPRRYCSPSAFPWTADEIARLDASLEDTANQYLLCTGDAANERSFVATITAPNEPLLAKLGASRGAFGASIEYQVVSACSATELAAPLFAGPASSGLLSFAELRTFQSGALWLKRFAANSSCRSAIQLGAAAQSIQQAIADGSRRDYLACDFGQSNDTTLPDCPPAARAIFE